MRLRALHTIYSGRDVLAPGTIFERDERTAKFLVERGAAVEEPAPEATELPKPLESESALELLATTPSELSQQRPRLKRPRTT